MGRVVKDFEIEFDVSGSVQQQIEIFCSVTDMTPEQVVKGLQDGEILTTLETDGDIVLVDQDYQQIGRVVCNELDISYHNFELA